MRPERQAVLLKRFMEFRSGALPDHATESMRNPASAYTDPARFEREMEVLFRGRPAPVGLSCECHEPGSYLTARLGGVPLVVVRQPDRSLRGFVNACRHRGAPVLAGRGDGLRAIACPYHGWTYNLDGTLRARPLEWGFDDIAKSECSLRPAAVEERYGLIYAQPQATASLGIEQLLEGMQNEIAEYGLEGYTHFETRTREWPFNWKLVIDTFTEAYHIPALHHRSIAPHYDFRNSIWDPFGLSQRTVNFRSSIERELAEKPEAERRLLPHTTIEYFLLPNAILTHQIDHIELWRAVPLAVDRTLVSTSLYAPAAPATDSARAHWKKNLDLLLQVTESEDFPLMAEIYQGLTSGAVDELIYGKLEPALVHFHRSLNRLLSESETRHSSGTTSRASSSACSS
jgi:phenylpropionate dioxygenase-like ring-hydroxylating dioxygenase large terminal subunit